MECIYSIKISSDQLGTSISTRNTSLLAAMTMWWRHACGHDVIPGGRYPDVVAYTLELLSEAPIPDFNSFFCFLDSYFFFWYIFSSSLFDRYFPFFKKRKHCWKHQMENQIDFFRILDTSGNPLRMTFTKFFHQLAFKANLGEK